MIKRLCVCPKVGRHYSTNQKPKWETHKSKAEVRNQFTKSFKKVKTGLTSSLDKYVEKHMDVIKSYNKKHMMSVGERIKLNLDQEINWRDIIRNPIFRTATLRYLNDNLNEREMNKKISFNARENYKYDSLVDLVKMTDFQKRFYTLMTAYASTIAKGPNGSGKSFALLSSAMNMRRSNTRGIGINSLILVKSNELVSQYKRIVESIVNQIDNPNMNIKNVAQFISRGMPKEELSQEDDLMDFPCPHILVATPQRLLDLLSSRGMDFIKINSLAFIGVDDFNSMIHSELLLETKIKSPIVTLLDYVVKLQDYKRNHNDPHPQIVLTVDESTPDILIEQIKQSTKWFDWNKFAPIGKFNDSTDIPTFKYIPYDVTVSTVLAKPVERIDDPINTELVEKLRMEVAEMEKLLKSKDLKKNAKRKLEVKLPMIKSRIDLETVFDLHLSDLHTFKYSEDHNDWIDILFRSDNEHVYNKHRNQRRNSLSSVMKTGEMELLVNGFEKLLNSANCKEWCDGKRILLVHEDEISSLAVFKYLSLRYPAEELASLNLLKDWSSFTKPRKHGEPWIYITNTTSLKGVTLPGLDTVFILGIDTLKDTSGLATVATRMRPSKGLIPQEKLSIFPRTLPYQSNATGIRGRLFIVASSPDFGNLERNFLERSFILNGLVRQQPSVEEYEEWSEVDQTRYISATGIDNYKTDGRMVTFNGFDKELKDAAKESNITIG